MRNLHTTSTGTKGVLFSYVLFSNKRTTKLCVSGPLTFQGKDESKCYLRTLHPVTPATAPTLTSKAERAGAFDLGTRVEREACRAFISLMGQEPCACALLTPGVSDLHHAREARAGGAGHPTSSINISITWRQFQIKPRRRLTASETLGMKPIGLPCDNPPSVLMSAQVRALLHYVVMLP